MKASRLLASALVFLPVVASAQQPQPQSPIVTQLKSQLGELMFNNANLAGQVQDLTNQNAVLNAKLKEMEDAAKTAAAKNPPPPVTPSSEDTHPK